MVLSREQSVEIKKQIIAQVENSSMENKTEIIKSIGEMDEVELENFLKANNIPISGVDGSSGNDAGGSKEVQSKCIFCSIVNKEVDSYILEENDKAIAILELNPFSEGHSIILPKKHVSVDKLPKSAMTLAQKIAKRIKKKLKCEDVKIEISNFHGHTMINVIPVYAGKQMEKKKSSEKELEKMKKKLEIKKRSKRVKKIAEKNMEEDLSKLPKVKFRIP